MSERERTQRREARERERERERDPSVCEREASELRPASEGSEVRGGERAERESEREERESG